jgi:hypothetical protein
LNQSMQDGDLLMPVWTPAEDTFSKPLFIQKLFELAGSRYRVRDLRQEVVTEARVQSLVLEFEDRSLKLSGLEDTADYGLQMTAIRFDLKALAEKGLNLAQVVTLLRQLADDPSHCARLFREAGMEEKSGYWLVGRQFLDFVQTVYAQQAAQQAIARAA